MALTLILTVAAGASLFLAATFLRSGFIRLFATRTHGDSDNG